VNVVIFVVCRAGSVLVDAAMQFYNTSPTNGEIYDSIVESANDKNVWKGLELDPRSVQVNDINIKGKLHV